MLGVMGTDQARRLAREKDLDLVEVNPKAQPPVCKVMDFGRFKYEEKKRQNEAKKRQTQAELKEIKLRPKTDDHDLDFKTKHVRRFIEEGNKVKITCRFRGREITHPETARRQLDLIVEAVDEIAAVEVPARMDGRTMTTILAPRQRQQAASASRRVVQDGPAVAGVHGASAGGPAVEIARSPSFARNTAGPTVVHGPGVGARKLRDPASQHGSLPPSAEGTTK